MKNTSWMVSAIRFSFAILCAAAVSSQCLLSSVHAQNAQWVNGGNGSYEDSANWIPDVPSPTDTAIFGVPAGQPYSVDFSTSPTAAELLLANGVFIKFITSLPSPVTFEISGTTQIESATLGVLGPIQLLTQQLEIDELGELAVVDGGQVTTEFTYGFGDLRVLGVDEQDVPSTWVSDSALITRESYLTIRDGARARNENVYVAITGNNAVYVGGSSESGQRSTWNTQFISSGLTGGNAVLAFTRGAVVTSDVVDFRGSSFLFVKGTDEFGHPATFNVSSELFIEGDTPPIIPTGIHVSDGGQLTSGTAIIGGVYGVIGVDGAEQPAAWNNSGNVYVGGREDVATGPGEVFLGVNGEIQVGGSVMIWPDGQVHLNGGTFTADSVSNAFGGGFDFNDGLLRINAFEGDLFNQGGTLQTGGEGIGETVVLGSYAQQTGAVLALDIAASEAAVNFDVLSVSQNAILGGMLQLNMISEQQPEATDAFAIVAATTLQGAFENVANGQRLPTSDGRGSFVVHYGSDSSYAENLVVLSDYQSSEVILGDINGDGVVNLLDVGPFVASLAGNFYNPAADINGDGVVNLLDVEPFIELLNN